MLIDLLGDINEALIHHLGWEKEGERRKFPKQEVLNLTLISEGGSVCYGLAIHDMLRNLPNKKIVTCAGIVASAATFILQAGDERLAFPNTMFMVHYMVCTNDDEDLKAMVPYLQARSDKIMIDKIGADNFNKAKALKAFDAKTALELKMIDAIL